MMIKRQVNGAVPWTDPDDDHVVDPTMLNGIVVEADYLPPSTWKLSAGEAENTAIAVVTSVLKAFESV